MTSASATETIWSQLSSDLRRFIRRRVSDEHLAEDLLQETFVRIHVNVERIRNSDRLAAWVYQIARNVVNDYFRKTSIATPKSAEPDHIADRDADSSTEECGAPWLGEMVQTLPEVYRDAVRMAEIEGLSQQDVADRLGISLSGAKSRVQRGRVMLKNALDRCCSFEIDSRGGMMSCDPKPGQNVCRDCG